MRLETYRTLHFSIPIFTGNTINNPFDFAYIMIRFAFGVACGVFLAQNYAIPDINTYLIYLKQSFEDFEKDLAKKNGSPEIQVMEI